jgi:hypothetical protein
VPLVEPLAPEVTVIHDALLAAVQLHPLVVVTVAEPVVAPAATLWVVGEIAKLHGAAACVTVSVCPAIVSVPVRGVVTVLAAIE